jgi:hypothetical protein
MYEKRPADCRINLHGRVLLNKGERPYSSGSVHEINICLEDLQPMEDGLVGMRFL